jgi:hypothetical protein
MSRSNASRGKNGFVLPTVLFILVMVTLFGTIAVRTSRDDLQSAVSTAESFRAFYAAEAGFNEMWAAWPDSQAAALEPGGLISITWQDLPAGGSYQAAIRRTDAGLTGAPTYRVVVIGRTARDSKHTIAMSVTGSPPLSGAALVARGELHFGADNRGWGPGCGWGCRDNDLPWVTGEDHIPPGWDPNDCGPLMDGDAMQLHTAADLDMYSENDGYHEQVQGENASEAIFNPVNYDPGVNEDTFGELGGLSTSELTARADHVLPFWDGVSRRTTYPTLNPDGTCNTSDPYNWGSNDPGHPCYAYHPIIYIPDGAEIRGTAPDGSCGYGQAIIIANGPLKMGHHDCDGGSSGSNPNPEPYEFAGIAMVKGCLELVYATRFHGTAYVDDDMSDSTHHDCDVSGGFDGNGIIGNMNTQYGYSSCAVQRAMAANGISLLRLLAGTFLESR